MPFDPQPREPGPTVRIRSGEAFVASPVVVEEGPNTTAAADAIFGPCVNDPSAFRATLSYRVALAEAVSSAR